MYYKRGFALLELLIVIFIIGILMQLLLPAVQVVRENARRMSCQNNLHQVGIGMTSYESVHRSLPPGVSFKNKNTWMVSLLPYIEQSATADGNIKDRENYERITDNEDRYDADANLSVTSVFYPSFLCPSDEKRQHTFQGNYKQQHGQVTKHNYVVNFGNTAMVTRPKEGVTVSDKLTILAELKGVKFGGAPFYSQIYADTPEARVKIAQITDGLSHTLLVAEVIQTEGSDLRGVIWSSATTFFTTYAVPNSKSQDILPKLSWSCKRKLRGGRRNPPCRLRSAGTPGMRHAARSQHPGGVNALSGGGSVNFHSNDIDKEVWRSLGTTQGAGILSK